MLWASTTTFVEKFYEMNYKQVKMRQEEKDDFRADNKGTGKNISHQFW